MRCSLTGARVRRPKFYRSAPHVQRRPANCERFDGRLLRRVRNLACRISQLANPQELLEQGAWWNAGGKRGTPLRVERVPLILQVASWTFGLWCPIPSG